MKIIADKYIPNVTELFSAHGDVQLVNPEEICSKNIQNADVLLVRTITKVDENLLRNCRIKFVGSASAGKNHIDEKSLKRQHINFCYAPGCNALAVTEYVMSCLAVTGEDITNKKIGIVGLGHVGKSVADVLSCAGATVLKNDPPLGLNDNLDDCDIITLHCSLIFNGEYPSHHLINKAFLAKLKTGTVIINAARGGVIDESALRNDLTYCIDAWEGEPNINLKTFAKAKIKTPHIAGYSLAAKYRATKMLYEQFCEWANMPANSDSKPEGCHPEQTNCHPEQTNRHPEQTNRHPEQTNRHPEQTNRHPEQTNRHPELVSGSPKSSTTEIKLDANWQQNLLKIYNPLNDKFDSANFKQARRNYKFRKEVVFV